MSVYGFDTTNPTHLDFLSLLFVNPLKLSSVAWSRFQVLPRLSLLHFTFHQQTTDQTASPTQHDAATAVPLCWDGVEQMLSGAWFPKLKLISPSWFHQTVDLCSSQSQSPGAVSANMLLLIILFFFTCAVVDFIIHPLLSMHTNLQLCI